MMTTMTTPSSDLVATLLVQLGSPSLASLVLARLLDGHLLAWTTTRLGEVRRDCEGEGDDDDDDGSFSSCVEEEKDDDVVEDDEDEEGTWKMLAAECYLPLLRVLDGELHASLLRSMTNDDGEISSSSSAALICLGRTIHGWNASWFCSEVALPITVSARIIDFLMASHPAMSL